MPHRLAPRLLRGILRRSIAASITSHHQLRLLRIQSHHSSTTTPPHHRIAKLPQFQFQSQLQSRYYSSGKSQADQIVDELQELYETAKDEFEIATESTDGATIYAASDRESARDALNQLLAVYSLYTADMASRTQKKDSGEHEDADDDDQGTLVELEFDPAEVPGSVKGEVRKRVGQRVRELEAAVEGLERRAKSD